MQTVAHRMRAQEAKRQEGLRDLNWLGETGGTAYFHAPCGRFSLPKKHKDLGD